MMLVKCVESIVSKSFLGSRVQKVRLNCKVEHSIMGASGNGAGPIRGMSGNGSGPIQGHSGNGGGPVDLRITAKASFDSGTFNKLKDACTLLGSFFSNNAEKQEKEQMSEKQK